MRDSLAWSATAILLLLVPTSGSMIYYLVHVAIMGIEHSLPMMWLDSGVTPRLQDLPVYRAEFFFTVSLAVLPVVALGLVLLRRTAQNAVWNPQQLILVALLIIDLAIAAVYLIWTYSGGLSYFSPPTTASIFIWPPQYLVLGPVVLVTATSMLAWRLMGVSAYPTVPWRSEGRTYLHERRLTAVAVALCGVCGLYSLAKAAVEIRGMPIFAGWVNTFGPLLWEPHTYALVAVSWVAIRLLAARQRQLAWSEALGPYRVPMGRFLLVWSAAGLLILSRATGLALSGIGLFHFLCLHAPTGL